MRERVSAFWGSTKEFWSKVSKKIKILLLCGIAVVLGLALFVVLMINHTDFIILYDNLTVQENAAVLAQLQEMGVEGKLEGSNLLIPAAAENTVRMQLAMKGYPDAGFGTDIYTQGSGLTSTQRDKDWFDVKQQEAKLEAMIKTFPEVRDAHVTINLPDTSVFVVQDDVEKASVAVKIEKMPGRQLNAEQVQGILNLVRTSVPGVEDGDIAIVDEGGDIRTILGVGGDKHARKLELAEMVNNTVRRRVLNMLVPVYGEGRVVVEPNTVLDTDESIKEKTTYIPLDPENPENNPVDYREHEYERNAAGQIVQGVVGETDNTDVPQYAAELQDDGTGTYYHSHLILDYLVSSEWEQITGAGLTITDLTVAVLIDSEALPAGERDQVMDLVATASGIITDKVSVQNIKFNLPSGIGGVTEERDIRGLIIALVAGAIALIIIATIIAMHLSKKKKERLAAEAAMAMELDEEASLTDMLAAQDEAFEPIQIPETQEQKLKAQIKDLADSDPEIVAQLIKTWLVNA